MSKSKIFKLRIRSLYIGLIGLAILWIGSGFGGYGSPEDDQLIRGIGGIFVLLGIALIVDAFLSRKSGTKS